MCPQGTANAEWEQMGPRAMGFDASIWLHAWHCLENLGLGFETIEIASCGFPFRPALCQQFQTFTNLL